jgi:exodeoxyribonuclease VII large subunit
MSSIDADLADAGTALADGAVATVTGTLGTNAAWGELRVVASGIVISGERSSQARARERVVDRLVASGDAAAQRRLRLPVCPRRIGVVAGAGTAGGADFDQLLEGSGHDGQVVRRAVPMAGAHAAEAVADGISALAECRPDVIVVARGGGAPGEMAWADSEAVARAVVRCPVPVWIAIGHATDHTVADLVPSAPAPRRRRQPPSWSRWSRPTPRAGG